MKNPIIEDFDPKARTRQLGSPLDGMPAIEKPRPLPSASAPVITPVKPVTSSPVEPRRKSVTKPAKKQATTAEADSRGGYERRTFDFFADQIEFLTRTSLEDKLNGGEGSMNAMVREAIDAFIEKRRRK